jgi:TolA-binding protein
MEETNETLESVKGFWGKYSKKIIYVGSAAIILFAGYIGYNKLIKEPKELKAAEAIFPAENLFGKMASTGFNKDSVNIVLNGGTLEGTKITGLLKIISDNSGTATANRATYMTGACYLQVKEFDKAIKYLNDFNGGDAFQVKSKAYIMLGHAYSEKNNVEEAMNFYKKAAEVNEKDESITPDALMLCGNYAEANNKNKEAVDFFKKLKDNYPNFVSVSNGDVDKHLARLGEFN